MAEREGFELRYPFGYGRSLQTQGFVASDFTLARRSRSPALASRSPGGSAASKAAFQALVNYGGEGGI
jgi:hypothetical protein